MHGLKIRNDASDMCKRKQLIKPPVGLGESERKWSRPLLGDGEREGYAIMIIEMKFLQMMTLSKRKYLATLNEND